MYKYLMKFRVVNPNVCLDEIKGSLLGFLEDARIKYNSLYYSKNGTGRMIEYINLESQHISITLNSTEKLYYPSKAIARYSRILVDSKNVDNLIYNRRLLVCDETTEESDKVCITDSAIIGILAHWIIDAPSDLPLMQKRKRVIIDLLKEKIEEILLDEQKIK